MTSKRLKFKFKKSNKRHPKTNKTNYHNVGASVGAYIGLYNHIWLRPTTQVRLTSHLRSKF